MIREQKENIILAVIIVLSFAIAFIFAIIAIVDPMLYVQIGGVLGVIALPFIIIFGAMTILRSKEDKS
jgi:hypothetical protein